MATKLYVIASSPVCRSVLLTEAALGLSLNHIAIDVFKGEHLKPEFLKLAPLPMLPILVDEEKVIADSAAINIYLVEKYGKNSTLYPTDPYEKAMVNQMLHFSSGDLYPAAHRILKPIMLLGAKEIRQEDAAELTNVYGRLEKLMERSIWAAGNTITLADFALIPTLTSSDIAVPINESKYPCISSWLKRAKKLPYYGCNEKGNEEFKAQFLQKLHCK